MGKGNEFFALAPSVKYRREGFGGITYNNADHSTRFFNHAAALVLEIFERPTNLEAARRKIDQLFQNPATAYEFMNGLLTDSTIVVSSVDGVVGRTFNTATVEFSEDRLYSPIALEMELTLKCARSCEYCAYDSSPFVSTKSQLSRETYRDIFRASIDSGVFYLRFTGGDPLTRKDSLDILEDADELGFSIAIASDLTVLTDEHVKRLATFRNLIALQTTLDGPNPDVADRLRGAGNFEKVLKGISALRSEGIPVIVGTVLTKSNLNHVYEIAQLLSRWDISYCVSPLYDAGRGRNLRSFIPDDEDLVVAYELLAKAFDEKLVRPADPGWKDIAEPCSKNARSALWSGQPWLVRSPDRIMRVDPYGRCYTSIHLKEVLGDEVYVGRLPHDDIFTMWSEAPLLNILRQNRQHNRYYGDVIDIRTLQLSQGGQT